MASSGVHRVFGHRRRAFRRTAVGLAVLTALWTLAGCSALPPRGTEPAAGPQPVVTGEGPAARPPEESEPTEADSSPQPTVSIPETSSSAGEGQSGVPTGSAAVRPSAEGAGPGRGAERSVPEETAPLRLTLSEAVALALKNNLKLQIELLNPLIEETRVMEALAAFDTTFFLNSTFETRQNLLIAGSAIDPFTGSVIRDEYRSDSFIVAAGLRKTFPTGGTFVTQFSAQRYRYNQPGPSLQFVFPGFWRYVQSPVINPSVTTDLTFSLRQPLLRNAGPRVNRAAVDLARSSEQAARYDYQARAVSLVADVAQAYWELFYQRRLLEVRRRSLRYAQDLYRSTEAAVAQGTVAPIELVRTRGAVAARRADLLLSRAAVRNAADRLRRLLRSDASDLPDDRPILPAEEPTLEHRPIDTNRAIYTALTHRADFLAAKERAKANDIRLAVARNQLLPLLDLTLTFNINGLGGNLASALGSKHHRPLDEVGLFHSSYHDFSAALNFELPLGNRRARSLYTRTRLNKLSQLKQLKDMEEEIIFQVREAVRAVNTYAERVESTATARDLARERLEAEQARYRAGAGRSLDVLEAQDQLARAEADWLRALVDYRLALVSLAERQGTLLEEFLTGSSALP